MKPYVVKQGDYLEKIVHAVGADPDEIWNDPKNAELKKQRDPNLLTTVRLVFKDRAAPRANEPYVIQGMGEPEEGTTDGDGALEVKAPVHVREIRVVFTKPNVTYPVHIGDMDPVDEPSGVRKRLQHLGYYVEQPADGGEGDDDAGERAAIHAFQMDHDLPATGTLDDETKAKLLDEHGI